jgi:aminoglycoside 3-N-acetyltransferase
MVHASLRAVGAILGGPDVLIDAILKSVAPDGTMMVYVGAQSPFDDVGRDLLSPEEEVFILEHCPAFDPATARANRDFGALAELFRTRPGALCSANPVARMAALGGKAEWLTRDHPLNYGFGSGSPLDKLCQLEGAALLVGSDLDEVTFLHHAESIAPIANKRTLRLQTPLLVDGVRRWTQFEEYDSAAGIRDWPPRFFAGIMRSFLAKPHVRTGLIGDAHCYLIEARALVDFAIPVMVETAKRIDAGEI